MDAIFGGWTKNTWTEIVLSASDFQEAAEHALDFMAEAGGTVAYLHGACFVYEVFGTLCITLLCVLAFVISATRIHIFADPSSDWYIPSLYWGTLFAAIISGVTSFLFMQVFSHTADTLLYVFAWNRELMKADPDFSTSKYAPGSIRDMMPDFEMEPSGGITCSEHNPSDLIQRAGWEYAWRRWNTRKPVYSRSSSRVSSARYASSGSMFAPSSASGKPGMPTIDEAPLLTPGQTSAREMALG